jgi:hypothetical protein
MDAANARGKNGVVDLVVVASGATDEAKGNASGMVMVGCDGPMRGYEEKKRVLLSSSITKQHSMCARRAKHVMFACIIISVTFLFHL